MSEYKTENSLYNAKTPAFDNKGIQGVKKYIDIDSTFRNRNNYPLQSNFVIPFTFSGQKGSLETSLDPVALAAPITTGVGGGGGSTTAFVLDSTTAETLSNYYIGLFIESIDTGVAPNTFEYRKIADYSGTGAFIVTPDSAFSSTTVGKTYIIRGAIPVRESQLQAGSTNSSFVLDTGASSSSGAYTNFLLGFRTGTNAGVYRRITSYNGTTKTATVAPSFSNVGALNDYYEILQFSYDNVVPLIYSGTAIFSQAVCYNMRLLSLTIPNIELTVGHGGTVVNYPYLYVQLYNEGQRNAENVLYSNNPASKLALFKVPVNVWYYAGSVSFITLEASEVTQTVKFKPTESLRFVVTLPDGTPLDFVEADAESPEAPLPLLQISALIEIQRID